MFSTLDLMTGGRAGWNVVTSLNDSEAANFGGGTLPDHDTRYDRADEFMEVVLGHWDTWEDDAILLDKERGIFADPEKVHPLGHEGRWFRSRGPFTVPPSPQGRPIVIQAGQSGRGREFAVRWGEIIFAIFPNLEFGQRTYKETKELAAARGRDPDGFAIAPALYVTVGETQAIAEDKAAFVESLARPIDTLALLSEALNYDFARKKPDDVFSDEELAAISGLQAIRDRVVRLSGKKNPTLDDFVKFSARGTVKELPHFVGTPKRVADQMEEWFTGRACDGFVLAATHMPGTYESFVRLVVPELQRRGLFHMEYAGTTLRENLGLARPKGHRPL
jgi:FMN-dependent oxidoreductase (nitrilotriacetate monooxygenase family)